MDQASISGQRNIPIYALREQKRNEVILMLGRDAERLRISDPGLKLWLIGSFATENWDAFSDIDVVCVSNTRYGETDFEASNHYPMDIFSLDEIEFHQRMTSDGLFRRSVSKGLLL